MKSLIRRKPAVPGKPKSLRESGPCLNCSTYLDSQDLFCSHCGQKRLEREDMSFRHLIGESFLDYFHFDSKFFRTVLPLIFKPGWLTLEFMKGKRKSFVEPFRLFLVISVIYFLLLPFNSDQSSEQASPVKAKSTIDLLKDKNPNEVHLSLYGVPINISDRDSMRNEIEAIGVRQYVEKHHPDEPGWAKLIMRHAFKIMVSKGQSFSTVLEHTASKLIFLLIPIFALLIKLFYIRRNRLYFEHLVFSLHIHAFFFLFLILSMIAEFFIHVSLFIIIIVFLVYTWYALRRYYAQSGKKTLAKLFLISLSYLIIGLPVFFVLLIVIAALTF